MSVPRLRLATVFVAAASSLFACAAPGEAPEEEVGVEEADLGSDEESFAAYEATDEELAKATPAEASPIESELTLYAIPAPRLIGLSWKRPGGLARRTLINNGLGLSRSLGHAAVRVSCGGEVFQGSVVDTGSEFQTMVLEEKASADHSAARAF